MTYTQELERRCEELQERLAMCEPQWAKHEDDKHEKYFLFFNRCLLAMCYRNDIGGFGGCVYNTMGATDQLENMPEVESFEEAKKWITKRVFCKRLFGKDIA